MFFQTIGPLSIGYSDIVIGVLHGGVPGGKKTCTERLVNHKAWTDLRDTTIQSWIKQNVPDVVIKNAQLGRIEL